MTELVKFVTCTPNPRALPEAEGRCGTGYMETTRFVPVMNTTEAQALEYSIRPFDAATAGQYFGFAFVTTISLWALAYGAGQLVSFVRRN